MDADTVQKVAKLARIELQPDEVEKLAGDMTRILGWVEQLQEVDTDDIGEFDAQQENLRFRADKIDIRNSREDVLANAPKSEFECFVVPKVIE